MDLLQIKRLKMDKTINGLHEQIKKKGNHLKENVEIDQIENVDVISDPEIIPSLDVKSLKQKSVSFRKVGISTVLIFIAVYLLVSNNNNSSDFTMPESVNTTNEIATENPQTNNASLVTQDQVVHSSSKETSEAQLQYYYAMDLLNAGNTENARQELQALIEKYPDFAPAKNAILLLK